MRPLLGTYVEISVSTLPSADKIIDSTFSIIEKIQKLLSYHDPRSELYRINASEGNWTEVSPLTIQAVSLARDFSQLTGGLFNPTVGGELERRDILPTAGSGPGLDCGEAADIDIKENSIRLRRRVKMVLDGIAKGWAVDLAVDELKAKNVEFGWINAGGDIRVFGSISLPVQIRLAERKRVLEVLIQNKAIATSSYLTQPTVDAPSALINPSGQVSPSGTWSVTADYAWLADALTKVIALTPPERRHETLRALGGECVFASDENMI